MCLPSKFIAQLFISKIGPSLSSFFSIPLAPKVPEGMNERQKSKKFLGVFLLAEKWFSLVDIFYSV